MMRYRLLIEYEDGTFRVMEGDRNTLLDYRPEDGEVCTMTREICGYKL